MSHRTAPPCVADILERPLLQPQFFGLVQNEFGLRVDPTRFACCEGSGNRFDKVRNEVQICDIHKRLRGLERIALRQFHIWPGTSPLGLPFWQAMAERSKVDRLHDFLDGHQRAWAYRVDPYQGPGWLWAAAAICQWRLGLACQVISFAGRGLASSSTYAVEDTADVIFVEAVHKLSEAVRALVLEDVITAAYNGEKRLVVEFCHQLPEERSTELSKPSFSTKGYFVKRAAARHQQDPLSLIDPHARSRLEAMCTGVI